MTAPNNYFGKMIGATADGNILSYSTAFVTWAVGTLFDAIGVAVGGTFSNGDMLYSTGAALARLVRPDGPAGMWHDGTASAPQWKRRQLKAKSADTARTSTSYSDDTHLTMTLEANKTYYFRACLNWNATAASDLKLQMNFTGTTTSYSEMFWSSANAGGVLLTRSTTEPTSNAISLGADAEGGTHILGCIEVGASGGTFSLQWALVAGASSTTLRKGSWLEVQEVH